MFKASLPLRAAMVIAMSSTLFFSCSKKDDGAAPPPPPPDCSALTLTLAETTASDACSGTGVLTATGAGGEGLTYKLDDAAYQTSATFNNVTAGDHTVTVKSGTCTKTATIKLSAVASGTLFAAVKTMMATNCVSCHNASNSSGGKDWSNDCNIIANKDRIKARAVDGNPSFMPQGGELSQENKDKITAWIDAGGTYAN